MPQGEGFELLRCVVRYPCSSGNCSEVSIVFSASRYRYEVQAHSSILLEARTVAAGT